MIYPDQNIFTDKLLLISAIILLLCYHFFAFFYQLYHKIWEYASVGEVVAIINAVTLMIIVTAFMQFIISQTVYVRVLAITWMFHIILIGGSRFSWRLSRNRLIKSNDHNKRALIVGAGSAGTMFVRQLLSNNKIKIEPVAFVDDNMNKCQLQIYGLTVEGTTKDIPKLVDQLKIDNIIIAIPSLNKREFNRIYQLCVKTNAKTKIIPKLEDIITGKLSVTEIRDVEVEDLLGRRPIELDISGISKKIKGKVILVTGAGGSIGSEICRQVCNFMPKRIILLGHGEYSIYNIHMELEKQYMDDIDIVPVIADIQDRKRVFEIMDEHRPDVVYHAAAHKHVPLMEENPRAAVNNNIFGTKNVAEAAETFSVEKFVLVSTDKAVNPPNVMGATKRLAEMIIQNMAKESSTIFVAVRFGNVLGSRGSVIPLFKKQIQAGGPVTVTHPEMTRYFMTIPEASRLVIQAGVLAQGGEVFVLDMGEPVKILDLARNLIKLSGYTEDEIKIVFTGIRPGEKMFEELLNKDEIQKNKVFPNVHIGKAKPLDKEYLYQLMQQLPTMDGNELKKTLIEIANKKEPEKVNKKRPLLVKNL